MAFRSYVISSPVISLQDRRVLEKVQALPLQYWLCGDEDHQTMVPVSISRAVAFSLADRVADEKSRTR